MGFILHLLDAPNVSNAKEADNFIAEQRKKPPTNNPKFEYFTADITGIYPDLSEEDLDGDDDRNLWEEGLDSGASYGQVKELVVKVDLTDESVVAELRKVAVQNGLKLYDEEGQVLYSA